MRHYELTCLISPDLSEAEISDISAKVASYIQEEGGTLVDNQKALKRALGYPVKKKTLAHVSVLEFHLEPEKLPLLRKKLDGQAEILRHSLIAKKVSRNKKMGRKIRFRKETISGLKLPEAMPTGRQALPTGRQAAEKIVKPKIKKVELEEIEKKLEEILEK